MSNRSVPGNRQGKHITEKPRNPILTKTIIPIRANCGAVVEYPILVKSRVPYTDQLLWEKDLSYWVEAKAA
jgi:hypothetical protein